MIAFLNVTNATDFDTIFSNGVRGILGLAFDAGSTVKSTINQSWGEDSTAGETFLTNLYQQNMSKPFFTMQLGRTGDPSYTTEGAFTIGEYLPDYETVSNMPKLERFPNNGTGHAPRWSTIMSGMTINSQPFQFDPSGVSGTPEGSVVVVLDSGYTYPPIPKNAVDAIYAGIDGAYYDTVNNLWIVPCNKAANVVFQFGCVLCKLCFIRLLTPLFQRDVRADPPFGSHDVRTDQRYPGLCQHLPVSRHPCPGCFGPSDALV